MKSVLFCDPQMAYPQLFEIMKQIFTHEGFELRAATNAEEAVKSAIMSKPDIIILKTTAEGLQLVKQTSSIKDIPVLFLLPPKSSPSYLQKMMDRGATAAISMDEVSMLQVIDKIKEILG